MSTSTVHLNSNKKNEKKAPRPCRVQNAFLGIQKTPEDALSRANMKSRADVSPTQLIGLLKEFELSKLKIESLQEHVTST